MNREQINIRQQARTAISEYIEAIYNCQRRDTHTSSGRIATAPRYMRMGTGLRSQSLLRAYRPRPVCYVVCPSTGRHLGQNRDILAGRDHQGAHRLARVAMSESPRQR